MGYDPEFFMQAAGVIEFTLAFALIWTPLVRRIAAIMLAAAFIGAIAQFGKIDAIGHALIIVVLLAIAADNVRVAQPRLEYAAGASRLLRSRSPRSWRSITSPTPRFSARRSASMLPSVAGRAAAYLT